MSEIEKWVGFRIHCRCCGDPPGTEARRQAFSAAKKRARNAAIKEGLEEVYAGPPDEMSSYDQVFQDNRDGSWWFWDQRYEAHGPYEHPEEARQACLSYAETL